MRVTIISGVFPPEPVVSALTSASIAQALATEGNEIVVITTFPSRPAGKLYPDYKGRLFQKEAMDEGYQIIRCPTFPSSKSTLGSRFLENLSFGLSVFFTILFSPRCDVIYGNTWPLFAQGLLVLVCRLKRIPLVLSIQDLYPESLWVQNRGLDESSHLFTMLHTLDRWIARNCAGLVVISEQFKKILISDRGIPENKISVIPNWIDDLQATTAATGNDIRMKHNIPEDAFLVIFGGNIGVAAGVEHLIDAFQHLTSQENTYLLIAGAGSSLPGCLERIQRYKLAHVKIHSPWESVDTFPVLCAADLCILPTQGEQSLVSVPSKLLSYMLAERPVLALASPESETARIVTDSEAGWVISGADPATLGNYIRDISRMSSNERDRRGKAGRSFVLKHFSKSENLPKVVELLLQHGKRSEQNSSYAIS